LAAKVRGPRDTGAPLALAMLRHTGAEPPPNDALVVAWVAAAVGSGPVSDDPLLPVLLPRVFEAEGAGRALRNERLDPISPWLRTIRDLAATGRLAREPLLDGCVRRFLRGGAAQDLRFFVRLHELLEPSTAEVEARRRDYLAVLPTAPGPVAELALRHLRRLDDHDPADVAEALGGLLFRPEAALVRAGMTWFDQTVRRAPERADDLAPALATAFHHESYDVQGRAAQLALKHAGRFGPLGAERVREAIPALPSALGERIIAVYGGEAASEDTPAFVPPPLPEPPSAEPFPATPATPAEMGALGQTQWQWHDCERWLAGFVHLAAQDREGLRAALDAAYESAYLRSFDMRSWTSTHAWHAAMVRELITPGAGAGVLAERPSSFGRVRTPSGRRFSGRCSIALFWTSDWCTRPRATTTRSVTTGPQVPGRTPASTAARRAPPATGATTVDPATTPRAAHRRPAGAARWDRVRRTLRRGATSIRWRLSSAGGALPPAPPPPICGAAAMTSPPGCCSPSRGTARRSGRMSPRRRRLRSTGCRLRKRCRHRTCSSCAGTRRCTRR
ncbi:DUF6493 family protein, partial [Sphaerisporangium dianthi]